MFFGKEIDLEKILKEIQELTNKQIREKSERLQKKHLILAYCIRLKPYRRIHIREIGHSGCFAHIKNKQKTTSESNQLLDIIEEDAEVRVVTELHGTNKEQIRIMGTEKKLMIYVNRQKPFLTLDMPCPVNIELAKATLKNGVLEIVLVKGKSLHFKTKGIDVR